MNWLDDLTSNETLADALTVGLLVLAGIVAYLLVRVAFRVLRRIVDASSFAWDDILLNRKLQHRVSLLAPMVLAYGAVRAFVEQTAPWSEAALRISSAVLILVVAFALSAFLSAFDDVYQRREVARERPIAAYIQLTQIAAFSFAGVAIVGVLMARSPLLFIGGLGTMTAVLILVFRDTILSFIASIQIVQSDLIDVGDRIEMPSFNVNGYVTDLELHTVTVENLDKSITFIPTHRFVSDPFRNWKGLKELGRRRIKRSFNIDVSTIRFLTDEELERFSRFQPLADYMRIKRKELIEDEAARHPAPGCVRDARRLTNIGTLRAYISQYLTDLDTVDTDDSPYVVRQLEPGPQGLPLEIYAFANNVDFINYEAIQADIFDHILAMIPLFGLRVFQEPRTEASEHQNLANASLQSQLENASAVMG